MRSDDRDQHSCPASGHSLPEPARDDLDAVRAALDPANATKLSPEEWQVRHRASMIRRGTVPGLADYRKVYDNLTAKHGYPPVSDDEIRARHLVAQ